MKTRYMTISRLCETKACIVLFYEGSSKSFVNDVIKIDQQKTFNLFFNVSTIQLQTLLITVSPPFQAFPKEILILGFKPIIYGTFYIRNRFPTCSFNFGNKKKSDGAKSGLYGGCGNNSQRYSLRTALESLHEWAGALS